MRKSSHKVLGTVCLAAFISAGTMVPIHSYADTAGQVVDLALGKPVQVNVPDAQLDQLQGIGNAGTPTNLSSMLTDGVTGDLSNWGSNTWFHFYRNYQRELTVDLNDADTVNSLSIGFGQRSDVGIVPPPYVKFYSSVDGANYSFLGEALPNSPLYVNPVTPTGNDIERKTYTLNTLPNGEPLNIPARCIKIVFPNDVWGWVDELQVNGYQGVVNGAAMPPSITDTDSPIVNQFPAKGSRGAAGLTDQFLFYTGSYSRPEITNWTTDKVLPILGYEDVGGDVKDWLFNDLCVLPVAGVQTPSGGGLFVTKDDLSSFLDFIFQKDTQLGAINEAADAVNRLMHTDKKVNIEIAIPWIQTSSNFGDIYGNGSTLSLNPQDFAKSVADPNSAAGQLEMAEKALGNREAAVQWYINQVESRFKAAGYDNLNLTGYYWYDERLTTASGEDVIVKQTSDFLKGMNRYLTWIPYLGPFSPYISKHVGFSTVSIQPNYAFGKAQKAVIPAAADLARRVGGSLEMEYNDFKTYSKYLNDGVVDGYMNGTYHTYYLGGATPLVEGATAYAPVYSWQKVDASSAIKRAVYDRTYEFVKGSYVPRYTATLSSNLTSPQNPSVTVNLPLSDDIVQGRFTVLYDASKVSYQNFDYGAQLQGKGSIDVKSSKPGVLEISFQVTDPNNALNAELMAKQNPDAGAPQIVTLHFSKNGGVNDSDVTSRAFMLGTDGTMMDARGSTYQNWSSSDIVPGSLEDKISSAWMALQKVQASHAQADIDAAVALVKKLPHCADKLWFLSVLASLGAGPGSSGSADADESN